MRTLLLALVLCLTLTGSAQAAVSLKHLGDFDQPVYIAAAPGDYDRVYVVEQGGRIWVVRNGTRLATPFADLSGAVLNQGEQGLLSMAFAPDFQTSRRFYVYFTAPGQVNQVDEMTAASADRASPGRRNVLTLPVTIAPNHNGGQLQFGPDAHLYAAPGDGGSGFSANAQNPGSLLGKILRLRRTANGSFSTDIWSTGLRNPWRFSFDRATGDLTVGDVGQGTTEEIDFVPASAGRGRNVNFGWDPCEGSFAQGSTTTPCTLGTLPVLDKFQSEGWATIVGGYVVRNGTLPSLSGRYVYGDTAKGEVWSARLARPRAADDRPLLDLPGVVSFGEDAAGCLYAASYGGPVYQFVENTTRTPCARPAGDVTAPKLRVRVPKRQRVRRKRPVIAYARCVNEPCKVRMVAKLQIGSKKYRLRTRVRKAAAGQRVKLRGRLTKRAARRLRRALRDDRRARIRIAIRARDAADNVTRFKRRRVRVR